MKPIKTIFLGSSGVGKTSLILKIVHNIFDDTIKPTINVCNNKYQKNVNDKIIEFNLWDTAGQERYRCIVPIYLHNSKIIILVYDITNRDSFLDLEYFYKMILEENNNLNNYIIVVGNKIDLEKERQVYFFEAKSFSEKIKAKFYIETSVLTGERINSLFDNILNDSNLFDLLEIDENIPINEISQNKKNCC